MRCLALLLAVIPALAVLPVVGAQSRGLRGLPPETFDVRREHVDLATDALFRFAEFRSIETDSLVSGRTVLVTTESNDDYRYLVFVPELAGEFPLYSAGTYILRRRRADGGLDQVKIFLRSDPGFFIRIWPSERDPGRSELSLFLAGEELHRTIPLPISLEDVLSEPFARIVQLTERRVDWQLVFPETRHEAYRDVAIMAERARATLHTLPDAEDGAMDENGNLVFIETLVLQDQQPGFNCSGFAKWIVDGLHNALYGSFLAIDPLKEKHTHLRGHRWSDPLEDARDPYFGLDWTRNLATTLLSASLGGRDVHPEAADVRTLAYQRYTEDIGFPVERLALIMYQLAVSEPGYFYIASLNREFGDDPPLNQHVHVAVLFPYFDETGAFFVDVMERNVETSLASLDRRYGDDFIHLVRARADRAYQPPLIRN